MRSLKERLDLLKEEIQKNEFLNGKGLSNEENIRIFCYDAKEEMTVAHFLEQLKIDPALNCRVIECDLYKIFLAICEDLDISEAIPEMEESEGGEFLLDQLHSAIGESEFISKMLLEPHQRGADVLILTGVGNVFPFMRVHVLLAAMQPYFSDIPIVVMYPGHFDNHQMRLFDRLEPSDYYRAFSIIAE